MNDQQQGEKLENYKNRRDFEYQNATEYGINPHNLVFPTIAWCDLVDPTRQSNWTYPSQSNG